MLSLRMEYPYYIMTIRYLKITSVWLSILSRCYMDIDLDLTDRRRLWRLWLFISEKRLHYTF